MISLFTLSLLVLTTSAFAVGSDEISLKHKKWLEEEVVYIITAEEKKAFRKLESEELRDKFIDIFWQKRDPTPGTLQNEFKDEHYKRIEYTNKYFGPRGRDNGWRTERGRIYIMLGEPKERKEYSNNSIVYPSEIWFYSADGRIPGVSFFYMIFFKRSGAGDFEIYHPHIDGPEALTSYSGLGKGKQHALQYLSILDAELGRAAISLNPLDPGGSLSSEILLGKIDNYPETAFDGRWATEFLESKGKVDVSYSFKPLNVNSMSLLFVPPDGRQQLHYALLLRPDDIEIGQHEDQYYSAFEFTPTIATEDGTIIFENSVTTEFAWGKDEFAKYKNTPLLFTDVIPIIPGEYSFTLRVRNKVSRTYFYRTKTITVPATGSDKFMLSDLILNYEYEKADISGGNTIPFRFFNVQYKPSSTNEFAEFENIHVFFQLFYPPPTEKGSAVGDIKFDFNIYSDDKLAKQLDHIVMRDRLNTKGILYVSRQLPLSGLEDGDYRLEVKAYDNKGGFATARSILLSIRQPKSIPRPVILTLHQNIYMSGPDMLLMRAKELLATGQNESGIQELTEVLRQDPEHVDTALLLSQTFLDEEKFDEAFQTARSVEKIEPNNRKLVLLLARASVGRGKTSRAIGYYERLLFLNPEDYEVLNEVADLYFKTGRQDKGIERLKKSLDVNPNQPDIQSKLAEMSSQ